MVKRLNVALDDEDHEKLKKIKGERSWEKFMLDIIEEESERDG